MVAWKMASKMENKMTVLSAEYKIQYWALLKPYRNAKTHYIALNYNNPQSLQWKTTTKCKPLQWFHSFTADKSISTKFMYQCQHCIILYTSSIFLYIESRLTACMGYVTFQSPWRVVPNGLGLPTYNLTTEQWSPFLWIADNTALVAHLIGYNILQTAWSLKVSAN